MVKNDVFLRIPRVEEIDKVTKRKTVYKFPSYETLVALLEKHNLIKQAGDKLRAEWEGDNNPIKEEWRTSKK